MGVTFTVKRIDLKRTLTTLGVSERSIDALLAELNKTHRHANILFFAQLLEKTGLSQNDVGKVLRRIGIDDITMATVFNLLEEEKIKSAYGRVVEMDLE